MKSEIRLTILILATILASNSALANPPKAYEGMRLYTSYCQLCHGPDGKGDGPLSRTKNISPADLTTTVRSRSDTILKKIISGDGRQTITGRDRHNLLSEAMPEWGSVLSDEQIDALIAYLRFLGTSKHGLMGDPELGFSAYRKYCVACHGEQGEGNGIMTKLIKIEPMDHSNPIDMNRITNERMVLRIKEGSGGFMPAWGEVLSEEEIEGLVSYIRLLSQ